ncbi:hypothetical protein Bpfe_022018 [Biomphalaria pfeifferi]|uniref:Uncharacterized protein n=1 Tax=Biomphalaria pfeifferi TaxID=112525 RepID=A0AAD8F287_BIOPF|nr:hypothetical protein Bpfe_022018 [Biomphalaria pfeifferi]
MCTRLKPSDAPEVTCAQVQRLKPSDAPEVTCAQVQRLKPSDFPEKHEHPIALATPPFVNQRWRREQEFDVVSET